ncbi:MAG TPA: hypothetical protein VK437_04960 [Steroidobacteraceae bacterium]|nr:hypothetical protein [Steroidobacteraceae bacterium]
MRMRNTPKHRKVPKGLGRFEPLRHQDHPKPTTRRQFIAQGFMTGAASVILPSGLTMMVGPGAARAQSCTGTQPTPSGLACDIQNAVTACNITNGAGMIPFICFDLSGGANIAGSNVLIGGPGGQLDFLSVAGYVKLGLPGSMVPNSSTKSFVDASLGLRYHSDSAHLRGIKTRFTNTAAMANVTGTVIPALSQNDTNTNPHNPMYGIYQAGARGALLNLIGTDSSTSGGNSMAPPGMVNISAQPTVIDDGADTAGLVSTGQLSTLLPNSSDITNVLESMKRISDAKYSQVTAYSNAVPNGAQLNANALGPAGVQACAYTKSAYLLNRYPNPGAVDPDDDPLIVSASGSGSIFNLAEYQASTDFQKTAAVMKLVVNGDAAAGTIELDGFDYHDGTRATGETRDFQAGQCIGAVLQYAALKGKPVMIYIFSDGSLFSDGTIDTSVAGRDKGVWTADNQNVAATYWLIYNPAGKAVPAQSSAEMSLQLGYDNPDGSQNTTSSPAGNNVPNLVQIVVLNYMALHSTAAVSNWPTLWPAPNTNNTIGSSASALDPLIMYQPLAGLVNGKVPA